jgi:AraC-like DNA-binding protein/quercetin dioxygenase-like cupin family protein
MKKLLPISKPDFFSTQVSQARRFYFNLKPSPNTKLVVVCGGVEHCAPDYTISRKSFPFYSVEFVAQGSGRLKLNHSEHVLQPGSVFSYGPHIPHDIFTTSHHPLIKYFVDFAGSDAVKLLKFSKLKLGAVSQVFPPTEIQPLFDELIRNGLRGTPRSPEICVRLLEGLILKMFDARAPLPNQDTLAFSTYQQCRSHINQNFLRLRSLKQISAECRIDVAYLCRLFQRYDQQTPYQTLIRLKMNYAAERLQSPDTMVKQIAEETGFINQFHFSRVFKSVFGLSPRSLIKIR